MIEMNEPARDLSRLVLPRTGMLTATGDNWEPYRMLDESGATVDPVALYLAELQGRQCSNATLRSYGMDLLRWWRFLEAVGVSWAHATRAEARDFTRWMKVAKKPSTAVAAASMPRQRAGSLYSAATRAHAETVLREFYDFHQDLGTGPIVNPFPLARARNSRDFAANGDDPGRPNAHHNPLHQFKKTRTGLYRPRVPEEMPRRIPDEDFNAIFARLKNNRDRALLAFWVSAGVRAEELLTVRRIDANPGQQTITVVRKGSRARQEIPASADAFVWLRLYQEDLRKAGVPSQGRTSALWLTLRRPWRPLTYSGAYAMFRGVNDQLGASWRIHDLRHTAAHRLMEDPQVLLTDVQWILGHRNITTTQRYLTPEKSKVIEAALQHHARKADERKRPKPPVASGYNEDSMRNIFGGLL